MNHEKHNAREQAGIVDKAVTSHETSPGQHTTPLLIEHPRPWAVFIKRGVVWLGVHGILPGIVAYRVIQALRLAEV